MGDYYGLTPDGAATAVGVISSICHGYDLDQSATLNGLENADDVRVVLLMLCAEAGLVERPTTDDF